MIVGVGIDIIEVERVAEKINRNSALKENLFSSEEISYCERMPKKEEHYAARFAAKEAFLKATGKGLLLGTALCDIEVKQDESGKPFIDLHHRFQEIAKENGWRSIHLSMSHVKTTATAIVIIES